jgi:hypothetical protein
LAQSFSVPLDISVLIGLPITLARIDKANLMLKLMEALRKLIGKESVVTSSDPALDTNANSEVSPPWVKFPGNDPWWGGWRQGVSEAWLQEVWLPFWRSKTREEQELYLREWIPPSEEWRQYVLEHWR